MTRYDYNSKYEIRETPRGFDVVVVTDYKWLYCCIGFGVTLDAAKAIKRLMEGQ